MKRYNKIIKDGDTLTVFWDNYVIQYILQQKNDDYVLCIKHGNNLETLKPLSLEYEWHYKTKKEAKKAIWDDISATIYNYDLFEKEVL